jgi:hypothetical protein
MKDDPEVFKEVRSIVENNKKDFYKETANDVVEYDSITDSYHGCSMYIAPKCLYRTEKVTSLVIEVSQGCYGLSIDFEYSAINFDNKTKKRIFLGDYFDNYYRGICSVKKLYILDHIRPEYP